MANLSLSLSVAEGGPIKDTQNKVLNLVDHIVIDVPYINFMFMLEEILLKNQLPDIILHVLMTKNKVSTKF